MPTLVVDRNELRDQVYAALRAEIIRGRIEAGERLHVGRLADQFGVSPTPVKEALNRLIAEGLVTTGARGGAFVTVPSKQSIDEIFDLREVLEQHAAARALARISDADIAALIAQNTELHQHVEPNGTAGYERFAAADVAFHRYLIGLANNDRLNRMYDDLHAYTVVARCYHRLSAKDHESDYRARLGVYREHKAILAALEARDGEALRQAITAHLTNVRANSLNAAALFEVPTET